MARPLALTAVAVLAAAYVAACAAPSAPSGLVVPRFAPDPERAYAEASVAGVVVDGGRCLRLDVGGPRSYVVVWPAGTEPVGGADAPTVALADGRGVGVGAFVRGGGGYDERPGAVAPSPELEVQVPAACPGPVVTLAPIDEVTPPVPLDTARTGGLFFPQRTTAGPSASARLEGRLVRRGPCLYAEAEFGDFLVVWDARHRLDATAGPVRVRDLGGRSVAVGDEVVLGGSGGGRSVDGLRAPLPAACPGDVWVAGEIGEPGVGPE